MKNKNKKEYKTLLSALAYGSTEDAQKILLDSGEKKADSYEELEFKLAKLYSAATDKISLEKQFAEIHPHSKFLLRYLCPPKKEKPKEEVREEVREEDIQTDKTEFAQPRIVEMSSNASGECQCAACQANVNGSFGVNNNSKINLQMLCLVSIVAIVGLVVLNRK
jgi:hypothetical protein